MIRAFAIVALVSGCGLSSAIRRTADSLDRAINTLQQQSSAWRETMQGLLADTESLSSDIRADLQLVLDSAIRGLGQEARCTVDFIGDRVAESLIALKASLLGGPRFTRKPVFCNADPSFVALADWRSGRVPVIAISGYDLDTAPFTASLHEADRDIPLSSDALLNNVGPYELVVNLREELVPLTERTLQIVIGGSRGPALEIAVSTPPRPGCDALPRPIVVTPQEIETVATRLTRGDADFKSHGPSFEAALDLFVDNGRTITYRLTLKAAETKSDWTTIEGATTGTLYALPPQYADYEIVGIVEGVRSATPGAILTNYAPPGPVGEFRFQGDRDGNDVGYASVTAAFRVLHLHVQRVRNCAPG